MTDIRIDIGDTGTVNEARDDATVGVPVEVVDVTTPAGSVVTAVLDSRPVGSASALSGPVTRTWTFTPDVAGSYKVNLTSDGVVIKRIVSVLTANVGLRKPAHNERASIDATITDQTHVAESEFNKGADDETRQKGWDPAYEQLVDWVDQPNFVKLNTTYSPATDTEGEIRWNADEGTLDIVGDDTVLQVGFEDVTKVYNNSGALIPNGSAVTLKQTVGGYPTIELARSDVHSTVSGMRVATQDIANLSPGRVTQRGKVRGVDTSGFIEGVPLWVSPTVAGGYTNTRPEFPNYSIFMGVASTIHATNGVIEVELGSDIRDTFSNFHNGTFREPFKFNVTSDGTVITGTMTPRNGHPDMTMLFSSGFSMFDTDPGATAVLTAGTDINPQTNYVYVLESDSPRELVVSISDWPVTEHIKVAEVVLQTAGTTATDGALRNQNWNDEIQDTAANNYMGHLTHICENIRGGPAKWKDGAQGTLAIDSAATPDGVYVSNTAGRVRQMHLQDFTAFDTQVSDYLRVVNNAATAYLRTQNLNGQTLDADGDSLTNKHFSFVLWGVINSAGDPCQLMVNLPTGSYNSAALASSDSYNYSVYSIPEQFQGVGFLMARFNLFLNAAGEVWTLNSTQDLRGYIPNTTAGAGGGGTGVTTFDALTDTPSAKVALNLLRADAGGTTLEYVPTTTDLFNQYVLVDGTRAMTGNLNMGTNAVTNVGLVDGIDIGTAVPLNTAKVTNANHSGEVTGSAALTIAADAVTYAKMQNIAADQRLLGNIAGATQPVAELTPAQVVTMIGAITTPMNTDLDTADKVIYGTEDATQSPASTSVALDWTTGNQKMVAVSTATLDFLTFVPPPGACDVLLRLVRSVEITSIIWTQTINWEGDEPDFTGAAGTESLIPLHFDGTNWSGVGQVKHADEHVNGTDFIPSATTSIRGLMSASQAGYVAELSDGTDADHLHIHPAIDSRVGINASDLFPGRLTDKLVQGSDIVLTPVDNGGGDWDLEISATSGGGGNWDYYHMYGPNAWYPLETYYTTLAPFTSSISVGGTDVTFNTTTGVATLLTTGYHLITLRLNQIATVGITDNSICIGQLQYREVGGTWADLTGGNTYSTVYGIWQTAGDSLVDFPVLQSYAAGMEIMVRVKYTGTQATQVIDNGFINIKKIS